MWDAIAAGIQITILGCGFVVSVFVVQIGSFFSDITTQESYLFFQHLVSQYGYLGIFIALFITAAAPIFPIPEEFIIVLIGYFLANGWLDATWTVTISLGTLVAADLALYGAGFLGGQSFLNLKVVNNKRIKCQLEKAEALLKKYGIFSILIARFIPGPRTYLFISMGLIKYPFQRFFWVNLLGVLLHTPLLMGLGFIFHHEMTMVFEWLIYFRNVIFCVVIGILIIFLCYLAIKRVCSKRRGKEYPPIE